MIPPYWLFATAGASVTSQSRSCLFTSVKQATNATAQHPMARTVRRTSSAIGNASAMAKIVQPVRVSGDRPNGTQLQPPYG